MSDTAGGFLPSPPASLASNTVRGLLPTTRSTPLRAGSRKESNVIRHLDAQVGTLRRRLAKRYEAEDVEGILEVDEHGTLIQSLPEQRRIPDDERWGHGRGYETFERAAADLRNVFDLVWATAAPGIQIPYTITLASIVNEMIPAFAPEPRPLFGILGLLDHAFASLIQQKDIDTGRLLPGFGTGGRARLTDTEKVRINSLVNRARVAVAKRFGQDPRGISPTVSARGEVEPTSEVQMDADGEWVLTRDEVPEDPLRIPPKVDDHDDDDDDGENDDDVDVKMSRVYDKTLMELGAFTFGSDFGPRTE